VIWGNTPLSSCCMLEKIKHDFSIIINPFLQTILKSASRPDVQLHYGSNSYCTLSLLLFVVTAS
jgi:hypothetical protein